MPNPTTIHDAAQTVLRDTERKRNMQPLEIGPFLFEQNGIATSFPRVDIYGEYENTYIDESEATKLVAMILEVFPNIREQINESKP